MKNKWLTSIFRRIFIDSKKKPYHYVRFTWWNPVNLKDIAKKLEGTFDVGKLITWFNVLYREERSELAVRADTLRAMLSAFTAVLYQRESSPFTEKDMELRKIIFELYPRGRATPLPWMFTYEPDFEVSTP